MASTTAEPRHGAGHKSRRRRIYQASTGLVPVVLYTTDTSRIPACRTYALARDWNILAEYADPLGTARDPIDEEGRIGNRAGWGHVRAALLNCHAQGVVISRPEDLPESREKILPWLRSLGAFLQYATH